MSAAGAERAAVGAERGSERVGPSYGSTLEVLEVIDLRSERLRASYGGGWRQKEWKLCSGGGWRQKGGSAEADGGRKGDRRRRMGIIGVGATLWPFCRRECNENFTEYVLGNVIDVSSKCSGLEGYLQTPFNSNSLSDEFFPILVGRLVSS